jgi:putative heme-binding domain-containing protein
MTDRIDRVLKATFEQGDTNLRQKMQKDFDRFKLPLSKDAAGSSIAAEEMKQQPIVIEHVDPTNPQLLGNQKLEVIQQKVVSLKGNPEAGKKLFENQACIACHTFADGQTPKGPHLVDIGRRYTRPELVESLIQPSAKIAQGFDSWQFLTRDGEVLTGFVVTESAERVLLRNGQGVLQALSQDDIEERKKQEQSMMPQGLVGALTVEQLSDLLAYLETLK